MQTKDTVRVILLDGDSRILMIKVSGGDLEDPNRPIRRAVWITPGGRIESGESPEEAVAREIEEETGLSGCGLSPMIGYGEQVLTWRGEPTLLRERFFVARSAKTTVIANKLTEEEKRTFQSYQWWTLGAMRGADEVFLPKNLPDIVLDYLKAGFDGVVAVDLSTPD